MEGDLGGALNLLPVNVLMEMAPCKSQATDEASPIKGGTVKWQGWTEASLQKKRRDRCLLLFFFSLFYALLSSCHHGGLGCVRVSISIAQRKNNTSPFCNFIWHFKGLDLVVEVSVFCSPLLFWHNLMIFFGCFIIYSLLLRSMLI